MQPLALLLFAMLSAAPGMTPQAPSDTAAINAAKRAIVGDIEKTLPRVSFESWVSGLSGQQATLKWVVNDCGEQTGSPADRGRDFPICAEVDVALPGNRQLSLSLAVGSMGRGLSKDAPAFWFGTLSGPDAKQLVWIKTLSEVPKLLGR